MRCAHAESIHGSWKESRPLASCHAVVGETWAIRCGQPGAVTRLKGSMLALATRWCFQVLHACQESGWVARAHSHAFVYVAGLLAWCRRSTYHSEGRQFKS